MGSWRKGLELDQCKELGARLSTMSPHARVAQGFP